MSKPNVTKMFKVVTSTISKHSPEILTGIGIAGMITTTVLAVKATPKAVQLIDKKKEEEHKEKLDAVETVKTAWKPYIPAIVTGVCSTACLIGASAVNMRRNAALLTAYQLSTNVLSEYKDKVAELVEPEKVTEIEKKIAEDRANKNLETNHVSRGNVLITADTKMKCRDAKYGGEIFASPTDIEKAFLDLNWKILSEDYASLNDLYDLLGMDRTDTGEEIGWNVYKTRQVAPYFDSELDANHIPVLTFRYNHAPVRGFDSAWQ